MKKNILALAVVASVGFSGVSMASPYSSWENEREYRHNNVTVYTADVESLPYDKIVHEAYSNGKQGSDRLQMQIARSFETGKFEVPVNKEEAIKWYNKAALNGNPHAAYKIYLHTEGKGGDAEEKGLEWLEFAADRNHVDAVYQMGVVKFEGLDMSSEDLVDVKRYFEKADKLGHPKAEQKADAISKELRKRDSSTRWNNFWAPFKSEQ
jgi:TPR repeat protein